MGRTEEDEAEIIEPTSSNGRTKRSNADFDYKLILELEKSDTSNVEKFLEKYENLNNTRDAKYQVGSAYSHTSLSTADIRVSTRNRMMDLRKCTNHVCI